MTTVTRSSCAKDIMSGSVVTICPDETLREAVAQLAFNQLSGLPVVDSEDRCVGVISASDILTFEDDYAFGTDGRNRVVGSYFDPDTHQWETIRMMGDVEVLGDVRVSEEMSRDLVSVRPDDALSTVAGLLLEKGVHRVLVLDEQQKLHGVISASDFVQVFLDRDD